MRRLLVVLLMALGLVVATAGAAAADQLCFRVWVGSVEVVQCIPLV